MNFIKTSIEGLIIIEPTVFSDDRGYFFESYNKKEFDNNGINDLFIQDNLSMSQEGVLRGLHFQKPPYSQAKLIRVIQGSVLDIAVDLRKDSETYGQHYSLELSESNKKMFYIPVGFAHGFITLENNTIFSYKCSQFYNKFSEDALLWNDKDLNINWRVKKPILSEKDEIANSFNHFKSPF